MASRTRFATGLTARPCLLVPLFPSCHRPKSNLGQTSREGTPASLRKLAVQNFSLFSDDLSCFPVMAERRNSIVTKSQNFQRGGLLSKKIRGFVRRQL